MSDVFVLSFELYAERKRHTFITAGSLQWAEYIGAASIFDNIDVVMLEFKEPLKTRIFVVFSSCIPVRSEFNWMAV